MLNNGGREAAPLPIRFAFAASIPSFLFLLSFDRFSLSLAPAPQKFKPSPAQNSNSCFRPSSDGALWNRRNGKERKRDGSKMS